MKVGIQTPCPTSSSHICKKISKGLIQAHWVNGAIPTDIHGKIPTHLSEFGVGAFTQGKDQGKSSLEKELLCCSLEEKYINKHSFLKIEAIPR